MTPTEHIALYDYGSGGVWISIMAESAAAVEERFPWLRVVIVGDPEWVTPEKYREIVEEISPRMRFELSRPDGWLAESDATLGRGGTRPERAPRRESDPPATGPMRYQRVEWRHDRPDEPVVLYAEIDADGFENRKVHGYSDGRQDRADRSGGSGATEISRFAVAEMEVINREPEFSASAISAAEFEAVWNRADRTVP